MRASLGSTWSYFFAHSFLQAYWREEDVDPDAFHTTLMTVLPKKGDLSDPNKWRGISLLSVASKLISSIIATRLGNHFIDVGLDEQCGGVFGKGCIDGTYNVKQALHTLSQHGADSYVIFADLVMVPLSCNQLRGTFVNLACMRPTLPPLSCGAWPIGCAGDGGERGRALVNPIAQVPEYVQIYV